MQNILSKRLKLEEFMKLMEKTRIDTYHFGSIEELNQLPKQLSQQIFQVKIFVFLFFFLINFLSFFKGNMYTKL